jgi:DNA (cytosine-5)-methyltransferase 1
MVRVLDLFCGMGGLSLGIALALKDVEVYGVDIDLHAVDTYNMNLQRLGCRAEKADLLTWLIDGRYDVIVGGPPCQPWSLANTKNVGEKHPLYPTFQRYFDIIKATMPTAFIFENVRGLITRKFKHLLDNQLSSMAETYRVKTAILNAVDYGVPQKRQRVIVVGIRQDLDVKPVLPQQTQAEDEVPRLDGGTYHRWLTVREAIGDLLEAPPIIVHRGHSGGRKTSLVSDSPSYTIGTMSGGGRSRTTMYLLVLDHDMGEKKLLQTNPRHGKPLDLDSPSRTVKVDGRGGDFCFDTMLLPVGMPVSDHVMTEKGGSTYGPWDWGCRVMPTDKPANTITEKHRSGQLVGVPWTSYQEKHPPLDPDKPARAVVSHIAKNFRDMLLPLDMPSTAILGDPRLSTHDHHYRRNSYYLIPRHPIREDAMEQPSATVVADARIYPSGGREHGSDFEKGVYRRLTVRECMRLQGFPDWWGFPRNISTSKKYKLVGEAVPPLLAYRIAICLGKALGIPVKEPPREEDWGLPYFRRAFADYFDGVGGNG